MFSPFSRASDAGAQRPASSPIGKRNRTQAARLHAAGMVELSFAFLAAAALLASMVGLLIR